MIYYEFGTFITIGTIIGHELASGGELRHIELDCDEWGQVKRHGVETNCT